MFTGEYRHAVDGKGRVAVPSRFRTQLEGEVVVARWLDPCLALFPKPAWEELGTKIDALLLVDPSGRLLERRLFGWAFETTLDGQGRLLLPLNLREYAGLGNEAVLVGSRKHAEIWSTARWDEYAQGLADTDALAVQFAGLGI